MSKKVKIDPVVQARQAVQFFKNLQDAVKALDRLVNYNITECEKTVARLEKEDEKKFNEVDQPKTFQ